MIQFIVPIEVLAGGISVGGLVISALGGAELLVRLPIDEYVKVHQFLATRFDPLMPICLILALAADVVLAFSSLIAWQTVLALAGASFYAGAMTVSLTKNVPINKWVGTLGAGIDTMPEIALINQRRQKWRTWNLIRTGLAVAALALNATLIGSLV